ncbi:hypothetical protein C8J56DRAFT_1022493 [Mycena floridula]|nr:hypothetical protein C8J56DRAFT_1022493 [Mycena floridula]
MSWLPPWLYTVLKVFPFYIGLFLCFIPAGYALRQFQDFSFVMGTISFLRSSRTIQRCVEWTESIGFALECRQVFNSITLVHFVHISGLLIHWMLTASGQVGSCGEKQPSHALLPPVQVVTSFSTSVALEGDLTGWNLGAGASVGGLVLSIMDPNQGSSSGGLECRISIADIDRLKNLDFSRLRIYGLSCILDKNFFFLLKDVANPESSVAICLRGSPNPFIPPSKKNVIVPDWEGFLHKLGDDDRLPEVFEASSACDMIVAPPIRIFTHAVRDDWSKLVSTMNEFDGASSDHCKTVWGHGFDVGLAMPSNRSLDQEQESRSNPLLDSASNGEPELNSSAERLWKAGKCLITFEGSD